MRNAIHRMPVQDFLDNLELMCLSDYCKGRRGTLSLMFSDDYSRFKVQVSVSRISKVVKIEMFYDERVYGTRFTSLDFDGLMVSASIIHHIFGA